MEIIQVPIEKKEEWNSLVAKEPFFSLHQSWEWGEFKKKSGWKVFRVAGSNDGELAIGAQILIRTLPANIGSIAYIPRGPVGDWVNHETAPLLFEHLHQIAREHKTIFLKVEPSRPNDMDVQNILILNRFLESRYTNQAQATIIIDLQPELDSILRGMHQKTRYNIKLAARKGVTIREGQKKDLAKLTELMQKLGQKAGFIWRGPEYFEDQWEAFENTDSLKLLIAEYKGKILAMHLFAKFGKWGTYLHGAASDENKNLMPNHLLIWEGIKWAKSLGCTSFDLWGIPKEVGFATQRGEDVEFPKKIGGLWGVYRFKKGFSNNVVLYTSAHDYPYNKFIYNLISNKLVTPNRIEQVGIWIESLSKIYYRS